MDLGEEMRRIIKEESRKFSNSGQILKTYGQYEEELGVKIAERAEVLAAMDCLMHHLVDDEDFHQWCSVAIADENNWNILDWDMRAGASRCESYMELAKGMNGNSFECIVRTFADIVRAQCFETRYVRGAFEGGDKREVSDR